MDDKDLKILEAINNLSPTSFVGPIKVNESLGMDKMALGDRLILLNKSGHIELMTSEYVSSATLPNFISRIRLTELGRRSLTDRR
ncbi:MAG TPA: hypothetical protein PLI05_11010 [Methanotrichaceae archaeon]|nr:MAG: hypothetical protein A4E47_00295 [Methanosaeta sp. PtaU1.Bin028]HOT07716.1 hypothetical protein [Methanotrichaceae archaeon]HQF17580.1 hypothetical protein [Methanotrichaceae archaeon]HQI92165.1 hypothetical protein [Methanotrichaceae archaeon]